MSLLIRTLNNQCMADALKTVGQESLIKLEHFLEGLWMMHCQKAKGFPCTLLFKGGKLC